MSKFKALQLLYIDKGRFQGDLDQCIEFGAQRNKDYIFIEKIAADKLYKAIENAMNETPVHEVCYDILEQALKEYRGEND